MPRPIHGSAPSNDDDLVPPEKTTRKRGPIPPDIERLRGYIAIPGYQPLILEDIENPGPNLPPDLDPKDPLPFFMLFFTDELFERLRKYTNTEAERQRSGESHRHWRPRSIADMKSYIGKMAINKMKYTKLCRCTLLDGLLLAAYNRILLGYYGNRSKA
jgi:hypothetical protein